MLRKIEKLIKILCWLPFVIAYFGYYVIGDGGETMSAAESVYAAIAIYFVNPVNEMSNWAILTGELLSVVVITSFLISAVIRIKMFLKNWFIRRKGGSVAVYSGPAEIDDDDIDNGSAMSPAERYVDGDPRSYLAGDVPQKTENHILMFNDDITSLDFFHQYAAEFSNGQVYICFNRIDQLLIANSIQSEEYKNVHFCNLNDLTARHYWKKNSLIDSVYEGKNLKVAITDCNDIGKAIIKYAYLNNVFSLDKSIEYHVWGCDAITAGFYKGLDTMNGDRIIVHEEGLEEDFELLAQMDRVILTQDSSLNMLQQLMYKNVTTELHIYTESEANLRDLYGYDKLITFGAAKDIISRDNIIDDKMSKVAKLVNYDYHLQYAGGNADRNTLDDEMEEQWKKLGGFLRGSNIARADHLWIEKYLGEKGVPSDTLMELEHVRWCRFHFYNRWKKGGQKKDTERRLHPMLVPFSELPDSEKKKDNVTDPVIREEIEKML